MELVLVFSSVLGAIPRQTAASRNGLFFLQDVVIFSSNLPVAWLSLDEADNLMLDDYHLLTGNRKHKCIPQLKPNKAN